MNYTIKLFDGNYRYQEQIDANITDNGIVQKAKKLAEDFVNNVNHTDVPPGTCVGISYIVYEDDEVVTDGMVLVRVPEPKIPLSKGRKVTLELPNGIKLVVTSSKDEESFVIKNDGIIDISDFDGLEYYKGPHIIIHPQSERK